MENQARNASSQRHRTLLSLDWMCQGNTSRNRGQPSPTGLEGLEAISSLQKVLEWLEVHVPNDPEALAKVDEDYENETDNEQLHEILEEDITSPVPSDIWEDYSQRQESQDMSEVYSDQELFQREDESTAARGEAISKLQSTSPALFGPMDTKDEPAMSPTQVSQQRGETGHTTPTSTGHEQSVSPWKVPLVPGLQAGACLSPSQSPGDRSPSLTASHTTVQQQRQSLFRRAVRAVCRVFLGTHHPQEQEQ